MNVSVDKSQTVLVIGASGGLAQLTTKLLIKQYPHWKIIGVDSRDTSLAPKIDNVQWHTINYTRGNFENLFRHYQFNHVLQLGRFTKTLLPSQQIGKGLELHMVGFDHLLDLCHRHQVDSLMIMSSFHVYGAKADNHVFLNEDAPLRANTRFGELGEVVSLDNLAQSWMWKSDTQVKTIILRPANIIGSKIQNAISKFLTSRPVIYPIDFNPRLQFIHEYDMARLIVHAMSYFPKGIYNVATDDYTSLHEAIHFVGAHKLPFPLALLPLFNNISKKLSGPNIPQYFVDYLKYPCLLDNGLIKKYLPPNFFRFDAEETLHLLKQK